MNNESGHAPRDQIAGEGKKFEDRVAEARSGGQIEDTKELLQKRYLQRMKAEDRVADEEYCAQHPIGDTPTQQPLRERILKWMGRLEEAQSETTARFGDIVAEGHGTVTWERMIHETSRKEPVASDNPTDPGAVPGFFEELEERIMIRALDAEEILSRVQLLDELLYGERTPTPAGRLG